MRRFRPATDGRGAKGVHVKNDREVNVSSIIKVGLAADLEARAKAEGDLIVGLAGAGQMGTDIVVELSLMPGVRLGAVSEVRDNAAREAVLMSGRDQGRYRARLPGPAVDRAIEAGKVAVTDDYHGAVLRRADQRDYRRHRQSEYRHARSRSRR